jgi:ABC-2 type transport system permease protein
LIFAPFLKVNLTAVGFGETVLILAIASLSLSAIGFTFAWRMNSVQGFHGIMNLLLMPMWLMSGAVFPATGAFGWMRWLMLANPLTYAMSALRVSMGESHAGSEIAPMWVCWVVMLGVLVAALVLAARAVAGTSRNAG